MSLCMVGAFTVLFRSRNGADVDSIGCDFRPAKDVANDFKNRLVAVLEESFGADDHFLVAHFASTIGVVKRLRRRSLGRPMPF